MNENQIPLVCDFWNVRKQVMKNAMAKVKSLHNAGQAVTNRKFGAIIREEWDKVKKEQEKVCGGY